MTIQIPPETVQDKILRLLGKERRVVIPQSAVRLCNELGPCVQVTARRESFITALFRANRSIEEIESADMIHQQTA